MRCSRRAVGLPFSGLLAGEAVGRSGAQVSLPAWVRHLSHDANEACARQPHHLPSTILDAMSTSGSISELTTQLESTHGMPPGCCDLGEIGYRVGCAGKRWTSETCSISALNLAREIGRCPFFCIAPQCAHANAPGPLNTSEELPSLARYITTRCSGSARSATPLP